MTRFLRVFVVAVSVVAAAALATAQTVRPPEDFFGFELGTDGELARYPRILEYLQHVAQNSDRVLYENLGKTTDGNDYVLLKISSSENLARLDRLVEINRRLSDPRGLSENEAMELAQEGRPFYFLYATIHATEVGNGQAVPLIVHRLATEDSREIREILDNTVLLYVPSQNPDGQVLVIDHWYETKGTGNNRVYPDLYHKYVGHDDNRDWFMFTQVETRLNVEKIQNVYKPTITHDMHQMGPTGARIFVPPFKDPYDPNIHPLIVEAQAQVGLAMAGALIASGKDGVTYDTQYDLWTPARQYMVYHGQPRILTEIASARIADPYRSSSPLGPQEVRWNFPRPYTDTEWRLNQIMDYGITAVFGGLTHLAKYRSTWLENFYRIHRDWVERDEPPFAFVIPESQRDPYEAYRLLEILETGAVEIHRASAAFHASGEEYPAGSWVVLLNQPYGAFAKTMLELQQYPDLRYYAGGPPIPPYDVTAHTLGYLMGVDVDQIDEPLSAELMELDRVEKVTPSPSIVPDRPRWAYVIPPESNAGFIALNRLSRQSVPVLRAGAAVDVAGRSVPPGAWVVPSSDAATRVLQDVAEQTGLPVLRADRAIRVPGFRMKQPTRVGLYKVANNMPAGWLTWLLEQYEFDYRVMSSTDFDSDLSEKYDVILLPAGTSKERMISGLAPSRHDDEWRWAFGIGDDGWERLRAFVVGGGTIVAVGNAVATARALLDLPIEPVLPASAGRSRRAPAPPDPTPAASAREADALRQAFESPAQLVKALESRVLDPTSVFYCPGSLLEQEYDIRHPVAFGMPARWPIFFRHDQAYRLRPSFDIGTEVVSKYPDEEDLVASGWLLGGDLLRDQANVVAFEIGRGNVVALGSQVAFRTQTPATFKLLFNALTHGPADEIDASELARLR